MKVVVVGAGITGLAAAHRILEQDPSADVTVLEASTRVGGMLRTDRVGPYLVERGPDSILTTKPAALALAKRLGLEDEIIATSEQGRGAYIVHEGELVRIPEGFSLIGPGRIRPLLKTPLLSWRGKARAALDLVLPRGHAAAEESLASFVRRRLGDEILTRIAQPLASGIYGADPELLSLNATMPRFIELERAHRSVIWGLRKAAKSSAAERTAAGARYGLFIGFRGGMQALIDRLAQSLEGRIRLGVTVARIDPERGEVALDGGETVPSDAVIVAVPAYRAADLLSDHIPLSDLCDELRCIEYGSVATLTVALPKTAIGRGLDAFGFVVPEQEESPLMASTFLSVKWAGRAPDDKALIRFFVGDPSLLRRPDEEIRERVFDEAARLLRMAAPANWSIEGEWFDRHERAMPRYYLGHQARVRRIREHLGATPRLLLAGNAYDGVGIPDAVASGSRAADEALREFRNRA